MYIISRRSKFTKEYLISINKDGEYVWSTARCNAMPFTRQEAEYIISLTNGMVEPQ